MAFTFNQSYIMGAVQIAKKYIYTILIVTSNNPHIVLLLKGVEHCKGNTINGGTALAPLVQ